MVSLNGHYRILLLAINVTQHTYYFFINSYYNIYICLALCTPICKLLNFRIIQEVKQIFSFVEKYLSCFS